MVDDGSVNIRQVATGTILTAGLLFGGANIAEARPNTSAMDRGVIDCEDLLERAEGLQNAVDHIEAHLRRLEARLEDAQEDGDARRAARIQRQIAQVDRVRAHLQAKVDRIMEIYNQNCLFQGT